MAARDLRTLISDRETPATIQSALDALDEINDPAWVAATRAELLAELRELSDQGSLF